MYELVHGIYVSTVWVPREICFTVSSHRAALPSAAAAPMPGRFHVLMCPAVTIVSKKECLLCQLLLLSVLPLTFLATCHNGVFREFNPA